MLFTVIYKGMIGAVFYTLSLQLIFVITSAAERCTKAVPVQTPAKRVHVLKRVPAACSNWDKSWTWLTKVDCGTKYRLDYVTVAPKEILKYKLEYVCCNGYPNCEKGLHATGFDTSDEKFLAIVLGSTAAAIIILVIVITISLCHKRRGLQCPLFCEENSHIYETADDDPGESQGEGELDICVGEHDSRPCEAMYEEIGDSKVDKSGQEDLVPRYTDIFKEKEKLAAQQDFMAASDPFNNATAPPLTPATRDIDYANGSNVTQVKEVLTDTARILEQQNASDDICSDTEKNYYNCGVKKDINSAEDSPSLLNPKSSNDYDSISNTSNCSNYEQLLDPVRDNVEVHHYQHLLNKTPPDGADDTSQLPEQSSTSLLAVNGRVEAANC
ncbi:uncharacterized protein LOC126816564 isoform X2 [Patella vulgata]|uniref:uncharacterized protein LOC126816564 isoform X2 n=1 Tax=Patella vulgata TaxID=6465 RepID=UPI00218089B0|nr:uncharacterized protein LOC126816564 isoform X2 [Patella vulgata]